MFGLYRKMLAIESAGEKIRAALVRKMGKKFDIIDLASLTSPDPNDDLPSVEAVKALAERLQHAGGPVVFVTPVARTFDLVMDRAKVAGLKPYQLKAAVKWEVEPYTGITGNNALIGVEPARKPVLAPGEVEPDDEDEPVTVSVSAMERNIYRALKARFKAAGFRLVRVYPPDLTFYMPLLMQETGTPRAILEVGENYSNFAILRGRVPEQISTLSLSLESINAHLEGEPASSELEDSLRFTARQVPVPEPLILSGAGAELPEVVEYISGFCHSGAKPLVLSRSAGITDVRDDPAYASYAGAVGAAVRDMLGRRERALGINDKEEVVQRLKKSAYLAPLVTSVFMAMLLLGHYGYMKHREKVYKTRIDEFGAELKERKAKIAEYDKLIQEDNELREKIEFAEKRLAYITGQSNTDLSRLIECLQGIADAVSESIVLSKV
ncbi:MAG: hypothetical protein ACLFPD_12320, partial [Desulfosudaceae bacterium]